MKQKTMKNARRDSYERSRNWSFYRKRYSDTRTKSNQAQKQEQN